MFLSLLLMLLTLPGARATIPEPSNVLHGSIILGTNQVNASQNNVVVEVQRPNGEVVTSYRMGQNPKYGDQYVVDIPMESVGNPLDMGASILGADLVVLVKEYQLPLGKTFVVHYQSNYVMDVRGHVAQVDFGSPLAPMTGYATWESFWGLLPGSGSLDADGDGERNEDEYVAGTDPLDPDDKFELRIQLLAPGVGVDVIWAGRRAEGPGYEGKTRHYALERVTDPGADTWEAVLGFEDVIGDNQLLFYTGSETDGPSFFKGRVWLEP